MNCYIIFDATYGVGQWRYITGILRTHTYKGTIYTVY